MPASLRLSVVFGGPAVYGCRVARGNGKTKDDHATRGTAPSAANIKDLEKFEASEEAKAHEPSDVDAMGQDKRREVIGQSYGPSKKRQLVFFGIVALVIAILLGGAYAAVAGLRPARGRIRRPGPVVAERTPSRCRPSPPGTRAASPATPTPLPTTRPARAASA